MYVKDNSGKHHAEGKGWGRGVHDTQTRNKELYEMRKIYRNVGCSRPMRWGTLRVVIINRSMKGA
jgi:hypothetical protein